MNLPLFQFAEAQREQQAPRSLPGVPEEVCELFEQLALKAWRAGRRHWSADNILAVIRFEFQIERGEEAFKCNDHWAAPLARWFLARHPDMKGFFELRRSQHDG